MYEALSYWKFVESSVILGYNDRKHESFPRGKKMTEKPQPLSLRSGKPSIVASQERRETAHSSCISSCADWYGEEGILFSHTLSRLQLMLEIT